MITIKKYWGLCLYIIITIAIIITFKVQKDFNSAKRIAYDAGYETGYSEAKECYEEKYQEIIEQIYCDTYSEYEELHLIANDYEDALLTVWEYYSQYAVFVNSSENIYHAYGCSCLLDEYSKYEIVEAEAKGYTPCKICLFKSNN